MNQQRTVIYDRRKNALKGERLQLDIMNMLYDTSEDIATSTRNTNDFDAFKLNCISSLGLDTKIDQDTFSGSDLNSLTNDLYDGVLENYNAKNGGMAQATLPLLKHIQKERGNN